MAVELKKFQDEYKKIQTSATAAFGGMKTLTDSMGNTKKVLEGAKLAIGDRVQELRTNGAQGTQLSDFQNDHEVKAALDTAKQSLANFTGMEGRQKTVIETFKKIHAQMIDLANRIDAEVASRKKKMFEPKSLPDMIKLGKTVREEANETGDIKTQSVKDIAEMKFKEGAAAERFWNDLTIELKKSANMRANAAVSELMEMFKPRLMKLRTDRVSSLAKEIEGICTAAMTAQKSGDGGGARNTFKVAPVKCQEMHGIVDEYNKAFSGNKSFLQQNPDFSTILNAVGFMASTENRVLHTVQATQNALR